MVVQKRKQCRCVEFRVGLKTGHKFHCTQQNFIILVRRQSIGMQFIRSLCLRIILMCELNNDYVIMLSLFLNVNRIGVLRLQLPVWSCITGGRFNPHMPEWRIMVRQSAPLWWVSFLWVTIFVFLITRAIIMWDIEDFRDYDFLLSRRYFHPSSH